MGCRAHHWAFDAGLFTLTADYSVVVSPLVQRADSRKFEMASTNLHRISEWGDVQRRSLTLWRVSVARVKFAGDRA